MPARRTATARTARRRRRQGASLTEDRRVPPRRSAGRRRGRFEGRDERRVGHRHRAARRRQRRLLFCARNQSRPSSSRTPGAGTSSSSPSDNWSVLMRSWKIGAALDSTEVVFDALLQKSNISRSSSSSRASPSCSGGSGKVGGVQAVLGRRPGRVTSYLSKLAAGRAVE